MGYELNKLMQQLGVATPGAVAYAGPEAPGTEPTLPQNPTADQQTQYGAEKAAFDEAVRKYGLGQDAYQQYKNQYLGRIGDTGMYNQAQFGYTGAPQWETPLAAPNYDTPEISGITAQAIPTLPVVQAYAGGGAVEARPIYDDLVLENAAKAIDRADQPLPEQPAPQPVDTRAEDIQSLVERYYPTTDYGSEVASARAKADAESQAFMNLMQGFMNNPENARDSKAEMYFRLAAAFGAPTQTGSFAENLGLAGKEMADYKQQQRQSRAEKLKLQMEAQKLRMGAAKEDLAAARSLATTDMTNRRALAEKLLSEYIQSGKPQSSAGKQAMDMGLRPGTPEFQTKVEELAQLEIQKQMAAINAQVAASEATARKAQQMSPTEIKLKSDTENNVLNLQDALGALKEAYSLNPNSFSGGWLQSAQKSIFEQLDPNDPRVINTNRINMLLSEQALGKLKATFGGNPTEGERAILLDIQGIGSKSIEERRQVMLRLYEVLQERVAREQQRLDQITSGAYKTYEPIDGGVE